MLISVIADLDVQGHRYQHSRIWISDATIGQCIRYTAKNANLGTFAGGVVKNNSELICTYRKLTIEARESVFKEMVTNFPDFR